LRQPDQNGLGHHTREQGVVQATAERQLFQKKKE
jgi:hypothetical protein